MGTPSFRVKQVSPNSHEIIFDQEAKVGWEQWVLLSSDRHHDNAHTDWCLERKHLDLALERNAIIVDAGDLHCAMQGKYDPRSSRAALRKEYAHRDDYLNAVTQEATKFYKPYGANFAILTRGNHETSIINRNGVDLTGQLVYALRNECGAVCEAANYSNWVRFKFSISDRTKSKLLKIYHGMGGGSAVVTRGVIQTNRMAVNFPDADYVLSGHTHDSWIVPIKRERITDMGRVTHDIQWHIRTPTYKNEHEDGSGWAVEKGHNPKPLGCVWIRFYSEASHDLGYLIREEIIADVR